MRDELVSVATAAERLGVSPRLVQRWIEQGKLPARPIDEIVKGAPGLAIRSKDLDTMRERPSAGRPKKEKK